MDAHSRCALPQEAVTEQAELWWRATAFAIRGGRLPHARRFLRWIVASYPQDDKAWLRLAQLAASPGEQVACLVRACAACPDSARLWAALFQAHRRQVEAE